MSPTAGLAVCWRDHGLWRQPWLARFLDGPLQVQLPGIAPSSAVNGYVGWGRRPSGLRAQRLAERAALGCLLLEDGFLRSIGLGASSKPLSVVLDDRGIYYDATAPSRLETLIGGSHGDAQRLRAQQLIAQWRGGRLSKYNHARDAAPPVPGPYALVVDQTANDASIRYGLGNPSSFARMLEAALDEHPDLPVVLKVHPDTLSGRKLGHFARLTTGQAARVFVVAADVSAASLLEHARCVYTVTSQMGFEALIWGKPVRTFGMPFYAGWQLTRDELRAPSRRSLTAPRAIEDLVHAALIEYPRYVDPETSLRCQPERLVEWMALQRTTRQRFPAHVQAIGFSRWKKPIVQAFLAGSRIDFVQHASAEPPADTVAVWGRRPLPQHAAAACPETVLRLEDGFLRSAGLGADLVQPLSWVVDRTGIYYDATTSSDLETLLQTASFDDALRARAAALRERIVHAGLTKYNVGSARWKRPAGNARVVLVPGQVESDASLAFGAPGVRQNMALLRAVREAAPDAYIVYKPHPDVVARLRGAGADEDSAHRWCDEVVTEPSMHALLSEVDEVHVMTSLAGFEALLRGKPVVTWGQPFYAGWGLTEDRLPVARRTRRLALDELVAAALILYPIYVSRTSGAYTSPERTLDELLAWKDEAPTRQPLWRRGWRLFTRLDRSRR